MVNVVSLSPTEYEKVKEKNEKKIKKVSKKHPKDESQIRKCIDYCLGKYLFEDEVCNKRPLSGGRGHFHLKKTIVPYVISYYIGVCTDRRKPPIVIIYDLDTIEKAEKKYDRK